MPIRFAPTPRWSGFFDSDPSLLAAFQAADQSETYRLDERTELDKAAFEAQGSSPCDDARTENSERAGVCFVIRCPSIAASSTIRPESLRAIYEAKFRSERTNDGVLEAPVCPVFDSDRCRTSNRLSNDARHSRDGLDTQ